LAANSPENSRIERLPQAEKRGGRHLRLVPPTPPRPRRIDVRISASAGRAPYGRSRISRLADFDLERLIATAESLEARG
jgi:hypothetical protein